MVYNEFSTGPNNQATDTEYREQMKQIFARFKGQSPDAFIRLTLQSRWLFELCHRFRKLSAPAADLGKVFCTTLYNDISDPQKLISSQYRTCFRKLELKQALRTDKQIYCIGLRSSHKLSPSIYRYRKCSGNR